MKNLPISFAGLTGLLLLIIMPVACSKDKDDNNGPAPNPAGTVTDIDGNVYHTVTIGPQGGKSTSGTTQVWMVENLRVTHYNDSTAIPLVADSLTWTGLTTGAYCYFWNDKGGFSDSLGALYNWYAVNSGKLAPKGWHVPTDADWTILTDNLGGEYIAGGKLKETGFKYWNSPNTGASNKAGFLARAGGGRGYNARYYGIDTLQTGGIGYYYGYWWTTTPSEYDQEYAWLRYIGFNGQDVQRNVYHKKDGYSVRCVKD